MTLASRREFLGGLGSGIVLAVGGWAAGAAAQGEKMVPTGTDVLLVVDVQNCFIPGGSLAVPGGDEIVPLVNQLAKRFAHVVLTQDWHTPGHVSFASTHGKSRSR